MEIILVFVLLWLKKKGGGVNKMGKFGIIVVVIVVLLVLAIAPLWPTDFKIFSYTRRNGSIGYGLMWRDAWVGAWSEFAYGADSEEEASKWIKQQHRFVPALGVLCRIMSSTEKVQIFKAVVQWITYTGAKVYSAPLPLQEARMVYWHGLSEGTVAVRLFQQGTPGHAEAERQWRGKKER